MPAERTTGSAGDVSGVSRDSRHRKTSDLQSNPFLLSEVDQERTPKFHEIIGLRLAFCATKCNTGDSIAQDLIIADPARVGSTLSTRERRAAWTFRSTLRVVGPR